ncbi:MAG: diadenylate cyclase [Bacteroidales bacterium]|nr:diadenylate cyclase [Bacteroidales bacterium]MBP5645217.1 diadenylate cyclase [Bacteroidales bacterium]
MPFPTIHVVDVLDVIIVAFFIYQLYRLLRGTNVMRIFWAVLIIYLTWRLSVLLGMRLTGEILGGIMSIGLIALVIVFQPEIRKFLLMVGTKTQLTGDTVKKRFQFWRKDLDKHSGMNLDPYVQACLHMSQTKTGALIIFKRSNEVEELVATGERINAIASSALLETLFFKNSPLHDGAVIVHGNTVLAARCILPVTARTDIDPNLGLRHRSAIGVTEQLDVISVIVSEETGAISYAVGGEIHHDVSPAQLQRELQTLLENV